MPETPLDALLDAVEWRELPLTTPAFREDPYATHEGTLEINGLKLTCYVLNTGERVFDADAFVDALHEEERRV